MLVNSKLNITEVDGKKAMDVGLRFLNNPITATQEDFTLR